METYDETVLRRIGYILFLIVLAVYMFNIGGSEAEILNAAEDTRTIMTFGKYEQDNNPDNGPEDIEWIVLKEQDGKLLLLSRYGLDAVPYNDRNTDVTWENRSLRSWMNNDFLAAAFSPEEQAAILVTNVENGPEQGRKSGIPGGADTQDRLFLLSYREAFALYLIGNGKRMCTPTDNAAAHGAYHWDDYMADDRPGGTWWLRSPGKVQAKALIVDYDGGLMSSDIRLKNHAVRPALWLDPAPDGQGFRTAGKEPHEAGMPEI